MAQTHDIIVIGSGPGGYVAAIRAGQLGKKVVCVERERLGGICLIWGCIPTKALLRSAEVLDTCRRAAEFGVTISGDIGFDFKKIMDRSRVVVDGQEKGVAYLFKKNKVESVFGNARLAGGGKVVVKLREGGETTLQAPAIIVATGARAKSLPGVTIDGENVLDYRAMLAAQKQPKSIVVIGAGAIGVEFASFLRTLGTEVTLVEYLPTVVPLEDDDVSALLLSSFKKRGINCLVGQQVTSVARKGDQMEVTVADRKDPSKTKIVQAEKVLMAVGVQANIENIGLEQNGVEVERGFIKIDDVTYATTAPGIYAIGDVAGPPALAHTASQEAILCVERIAGLDPPPIDYDSNPACTFCHPEIGSVGLTEKKAREAGLKIKVGKFPFRALGKARAAGEMEGFVKVIYAEDDQRILGAHIIGPGASDLISEYTLAKSTEVNAESLVATIHAHPTFAEALKGATEDALGHAIDL